MTRRKRSAAAMLELRKMEHKPLVDDATRNGCVHVTVTGVALVMKEQEMRRVLPMCKSMRFKDFGQTKTVVAQFWNKDDAYEAMLANDGTCHGGYVWKMECPSVYIPPGRRTSHVSAPTDSADNLTALEASGTSVDEMFRHPNALPNLPVALPASCSLRRRKKNPLAYQSHPPLPPYKPPVQAASTPTTDHKKVFVDSSVVVANLPKYITAEEVQENLKVKPVDSKVDTQMGVMRFTFKSEKEAVEAVELLSEKPIGTAQQLGDFLEEQKLDGKVVPAQIFDPTQKTLALHIPNKLPEGYADKVCPKCNSDCYKKTTKCWMPGCNYVFPE